MTIIIPIPAILGGMLASILYYMVSHGWLVGMTAPFLPLFVIALSGMIYGRAGATVSALATIPFLLMLLSVSEALLIIATQIVPLVLCIRALMMALVRPDPPALVWAPLGAGILAMAFYSAFYHVMMIATDNALYRYVVERMRDEATQHFSELEPEIAVMVKKFLTEMPHLIIASEFWLWGITVVGVILLAQFVAETFGMQRRPTPVLTPHSPPDYVLALVGLSAATSFLDYQPLVHGGQAASLILLLPYFFSGLSVIHTKLRSFKNGGAWLMAFYLFFMMTLWPLLLVTLFGLLRHLGQYSLPQSKPNK